MILETDKIADKIEQFPNKYLYCSQAQWVHILGGLEERGLRNVQFLQLDPIRVTEKTLESAKSRK
jgi:hypothetical protein